jgi:predicted transcriptional regulator
MENETAGIAYADRIKALRERRGPVPQHLTERVKEQNRAQKAILAAITEEARTVPEIAAATEIDTQTVFWHIAALRKYNQVQEEKKRGDYTTYIRKQG